MPKRKYVSPEVIKNLYWKEGKPLWEIGEICKCSSSHIERIMIANDIPRRKAWCNNEAFRTGVKW